MLLLVVTLMIVVLVSKWTVAKIDSYDYRHQHDLRSNRHYEVDASVLMSTSTFCAHMQRRDEERKEMRGDEAEEGG